MRETDSSQALWRFHNQSGMSEFLKSDLEIAHKRLDLLLQLEQLTRKALGQLRYVQASGGCPLVSNMRFAGELRAIADRLRSADQA